MTAPPGGLEITALTHAYGQREILRDISLSVERGEWVAITGESGSGKSTLLNMIAGLETPLRGLVRLGGVTLSALDDDGRTELRRTQIGFVFQSFLLLPHLTVSQNVELPLVLQGVNPRERRARAGELLRSVGLADRGPDRPRELSGGELQRVAVARALVHRPTLVLADEPTGNLDSDAGNRVLALLSKHARDEGAVGLLVTHSALAAAGADRVLTLEQGQLRTRRLPPS